MPGRRRCRCVGFQPRIRYFEPRHEPEREERTAHAGPGERVLKVEELESLRLKDYLGLKQEEAAARMGVSQPTFHRILSEAHRKIAEAVVEGKAIRIEGGDYMIRLEEAPLLPGPKFRYGWRGGRQGRAADFEVREGDR
jgi:predicted DNA-binding protein (UPF0251 family)